MVYNRVNFPIPSCPPITYAKAEEIYPELTKKINLLGRILRDTLFYPLSGYKEWNAEKNPKAYRAIQNEIGFYNRFWSGSEPKDLNLEHAEFIRQNYVVYDQPVVVSLESGKKITASCRIVESKDCPSEVVFNAMLIPGNVSLHNTNLMGFYDFIVAHSKQQSHSPVRYCMFGHYEMVIENDSLEVPYTPPTLDASGEVLKRMIAALEGKYGKFNLIYGHSLGCITLASLLKRSGTELLPALFHFDRGPSSIYEASRSYAYVGRILDAITRWSGLTIDIDVEIKRFFKRCKNTDPLKLENSGCVVTGAEEDHVFPGKANLVNSGILDKLQKKINFTKWVFNPPVQMCKTQAHHSWRLVNFNKGYLTSSSGNQAMQSQENLAQAIVRLAQKNLGVVR